MKLELNVIFKIRPGMLFDLLNTRGTLLTTERVMVEGILDPFNIYRNWKINIKILGKKTDEKY